MEHQKNIREWYVGESNEIAHLLNSQIATNTSPNIKKNLLQKNQIFLQNLTTFY